MEHFLTMANLKLNLPYLRPALLFRMSNPTLAFSPGNSPVARRVQRLRLTPPNLIKRFTFSHKMGQICFFFLFKILIYILGLRG